MIRQLFALAAVLGVLCLPAPAQVFYDQCGMLVVDPWCPPGPPEVVFHEDNSGRFVALLNTGGFMIGDHVRLQQLSPGTLIIDGECAASVLFVNTLLTACPTVGTPFASGDGSGTACPCGNASAVGSNRGCMNSTGESGLLLATGGPSVSADTLLLAGYGMPDGPALYIQGSTQLSGGSGVVFGDGLLGTGGAIVRLGIRMNISGASTFPPVGDPSLSVSGGAAPGSIVHYQVFYRDSATFCLSPTFNLTNALTITWTN
jgi:hypothetical protein